MRVATLVAVLLVGVGLTGCATDGASGRDREGSGSGSPEAPATWPPLEEAVVRPGVQVLSARGQCTSNFVFTSPDNASLYVGLAAHCVEGLALGDPLVFGNEAATGTLAYSSWITMGLDAADETCAHERDAAVCRYNDFALVRVGDAFRALVHPAMRHFGGPTAVAGSSAVEVGDKVLTYGNSGLRQQVDQASWHEGVVQDRPHAWTSTVYTLTPGIPGDSGSGVLDAQGRALGVVVTLTVLPTTGSNGVTSLDLALAYAKAKAGVDVRLATWEVLDPGLLPGEGPDGLPERVGV